jgi:hypothetical protein
LLFKRAGALQADTGKAATLLRVRVINHLDSKMDCYDTKARKSCDEKGKTKERKRRGIVWFQ